MLAELLQMRTSGERVNYLRINYPVLYCKLLRDTSLGGDKSMINYWKGLRESVECYTYHVLMYIEPMIFEAKVTGLLKRNTKKKIITIHGYKCKYKGDVDIFGNAMGFGTATDTECGYRFTGTFVNDQLQGVCTAAFATWTTVGEKRDGQWYGKQTYYSKKGKI